MADEKRNDGTNERKKETKAERDDRIAKKIDRKITLAGRDDTAVRVVRSTETRIMLDMQPSADKALNIMRSKGGLDPRYTTDKVKEFTDRFLAILVDMHRLTKEMCTLTNTEYRPPWIMKARDEAEAKAKKAEGGESPADIKSEVIALGDTKVLRTAKKAVDA